ncbi:tyrosine-type recombinase/integrase [Saccharopolyspora sp. NPDC002686]|uniref:tyrosine-type recombinase/integrase n=1 Tax=Saccharopolyspora sp. NPDC002686 TaxID=3154541 RepID=UPI00332026B4
MASAEQLPSGRWRGVYRDANRKKKHVPGTFERKQDAREAAQDAEVRERRKAARESGTLSARTTWGHWWEAFNAEREFDSDTATTEFYIVKNYLLPRWADVPLNQITKPDIQRWVDKIKRGKSPSYVQRIYSVFRVSITAALDEEILIASPCAGVKIPKRQKRAKEYLSVDHTAKMDKHLTEDYKDAVDFMLETGLRPGELTGLHAHRVDRSSGWLLVAETYVFKRKEIRPWPKDKDARTVPLSAKADAILDRRLASRNLNEGCGIPHIGGEKCSHPLVFLTASGRPMNRDTLNYHLRKACDAAGITRKTAYTTRRGYATRLAEAGLDVFELARLMGHEDIKQTQEYVQQTSTARTRVLQALGEHQPLQAVDGVGHRGTTRGTDLEHSTTPEAPKESAS